MSTKYLAKHSPQLEATLTGAVKQVIQEQAADPVPRVAALLLQLPLLALPLRELLLQALLLLAHPLRALPLSAWLSWLLAAARAV